MDENNSDLWSIQTLTILSVRLIISTLLVFFDTKEAVTV